MHRKSVIRSTAALLPLLAAAAHAALPPVGGSFAAPTAFTAPNAGFGTLRVILALALVLAAVFAAAALLRRLRVLNAAGTPDLQIVTQISLGARERAVLLRAGGQQLLVGVAPGNVRLLHVLPDDAPAAAAAVPGSDRSAAARASFGELLRRSLGR